MKIQIRKMEEEDIPQIYEYIHKNYVHEYYPMAEQEQWEAHSMWYHFVLHSDSYFFYILELEEEFIGTIRYEREEEKALVSIYVRKEYRGKGYGKLALRESMKKVFQASDIAEMEAIILEENEVSRNLFVDCGFIAEQKEKYCYYSEGKEKK